MPSGHGRTWKVGGRRGEEVEEEEMGGARVNKNVSGVFHCISPYCLLVAILHLVLHLAKPGCVFWCMVQGW